MEMRLSGTGISPPPPFCYYESEERKTMNIPGFLVLIGVSLCLSGQVSTAQDIPEISSREAYEMIIKDPAIRLVDVRSIAEYYFVGHPEMAANVPLTFWDEKAQTLVPNDHFLEDIKARYKPEETLIFICRSGSRSLRAARLVREAGFSKVSSVEDSFEGEPDARGYRTVNGWKNSGLPYAYTVRKELVYRWP
jgi:rhodanese-related sulfurtransferase